MEIKEYIDSVNILMEKAREKGDKAEWIRLARILIEILQEKIMELDK
jgi:hypothetical protein